MPDNLGILSAAGIGQLESPGTVNSLPKINFTDLPQYISAPQFQDPGVQSTTGLYMPISPRIDSRDFDRITPATFDNKHIAKLRNSSAFPELGYNPNSDEEVRYNEGQSNWEAIGNTTIKLGLKTWDSLTAFFGQNAETFNSLTNANLSSSWQNDNNLKRLADEQSIENFYPTFQGKDKPHWYSFIPGTKGSGDFYEQFIPQLGFTVGTMIGAVAENAVIGLLTGGIGAAPEAANSARKIWGAISEFSSIRKGIQAAEALTKGQKLVNGLKVGAYGWSFYNTAASEAAMEGGMSYNEVRKTLIDDFAAKNGYSPFGGDLDKIEQAAKKAGNSTFVGNLPVLMASNAIQFRNILFPSFTRQAALKESMQGWKLINKGEKLISNFKVSASKLPFKEAWKAGNYLDRTRLLFNSLSNKKLAFLSEGLEEVEQRAISSGSKDYAEKWYKGQENSWDSIRYGISDVFTDEGLQEFIGGALGGGIFQGIGSIARNFAGSPGEIRNQETGELEGYKENFLNRMGIFSNKFIDNKRKVYAQNIADTLNTESLKDMLKEEGFRDMMINQNVSNYMDAFSTKGDTFNLRNLKSDALNRFLYTGLSTGKIDLRMNQLNDLRNLTDDEFKDIYGFAPSQDQRDNLTNLVDYVQSKSSTFEDIYKKEGKKFDSYTKEAQLQHNTDYTDLLKYRERINQRYGTNDIATLSEVHVDFYDKKSSEFDSAQDSEARDSILREVDEYTRNNQSIKDLETLKGLESKANQSYIDLVGLKEGKKVAIFAASDMLDSSSRAQEIIDSLQSDSNGINFSQITSLVDSNSVAGERKNLTSFYRSVIDKDLKNNLQKRIDKLDALKTLLGDPETNSRTIAKTIQDYLLLDPFLDKKESFLHSGYSKERSISDQNQLTDLINLQKRHQDNLNLYNRLSVTGAPQEYARYETERIKKFYEDLFDKEIEEQSPENTQEEAVVVEEEATIIQSPITKRLNEIKSKTEQGEDLTQEDLGFLSSQSAVDPDVYKFFKDYLDSQIVPFKKGDKVLYNGRVEIITDIRVSSDGIRKEASFESSPQSFVPIDELETYSEPTGEEIVYESPSQPSGFIPQKGPDTFDTEQEQAKIQEHRTQVPATNRTIARELTDSEISKAEPNLTPGYTAWKQGFLDRISQDDLLGRYSGKLVLDSRENYPEDSEQYKFLVSNPDLAGLVLVITDRNGNDRFNTSTYQPDTDGWKVVHSMPNSPSKSELLSLIKEKGIESIPIDFSFVSQGVFDERETPIHTDILIEGISSQDYQFMVAKGLKDSIYVPVGGTLLRNGGAYIKVKGSYIKMLPEVSINLKVGSIESPNIYDLLDLSFTNLKGAQNLINFLETIFYTDRDKGGLVFNIVKRGDVYYPQAVMLDPNKSPRPLTKEDMKSILKNQRISVVDNLIGRTFNFYHIVDGKAEVIKNVSYNEFLSRNSLVNKKAYYLGGKKTLKPVNRYLTFTTSLEDHIAEIKEQTPSAPGKLTQNLTDQPVKKRRRFDTNKNEDDGNDTTFRDIERLFKQKQGETSLTPMIGEAQWIIDRFGKDIVVQIKKVIDAGAWATWTQSGIDLLENAPEGTGYHEAWHHFSQLYLTPKQREELYNEFQTKNKNLLGASNLQIEEQMAEDFRQYVLSGGKEVSSRPARNTFFQRILSFLRELFGLNRNKIQGVYSDLYEGRLSKYQPSINNAEFGKLNSTFTDSQGKEILNNQKTYRYIRQMDSLVGQILSDGGITASQLMTGDKEITRRRLREVYTQMYTRLKQKYNGLLDREEEFEAKNPDQASPLSDTLDDLERIIENFASIAQQHITLSKLSIGTTTEENEDLYEFLKHSEDNQALSVDEEEHNEADNAGKGWDKSGNETSIIDGSSAETKSLIRGLSRVSRDLQGNPLMKNGRVVLYENEFGLNEPVVFTQMFNNLGALLEGSYSLEEMLQKMRNSDNQKRFPELALLLERLPDPSRPLNYSDIIQLVKFYQDFAKTYIPIWTLVRKKDGSFLFKEETKRTKDLIQREWSNNFISVSKENKYVRKGDILFDVAGKPYLNRNIRLQYDFSKESDINDFLGLLGIEFSPLTTKSREFLQDIRNNPVGLNYLASSIKRRLEVGQVINDPIRNLSKEYIYQDSVGQNRSIYSENSTINRFLELESKYSTSNPSMSYRNARGDMQYGLSLNNWLTVSNYWLSRTQNYEEIQSNPSTQHLNVDNNPYIRNSLFLNRMFNLDPGSSTYKHRRVVNGKPVTLILGNYNGFKEELSDTETTGEATTSLPVRSKIVMDLNSFLTTGAIEIMRTESSASAFFIKLSDYSLGGQEEFLPISTKELDGDTMNPKVLDYFGGALKDEMSTIINLYDSPLPQYKSNLGKFTAFDGILSTDTKDKLLEDLKEISTIEEIDSIYHKNKAKIDKEVGKFLQDQVDDTMKLLKDNQISMGDMSSSLRNIHSFQDLITSFTINDLILNLEYTKLFSGNLGFYKAYHKRSKGDTSTGKIPMIDPFLQSYIQDNIKWSLAGSLGNQSPINLRETKTLVLKDDERQSPYTDGKDAVYKKAILALNPQMAQEQVDTLLSAYNKLNVADGQGHCTLDFYRQIRMQVGNWSFAEEVQYRKEVIGFRKDNNLYVNMEELQEAEDNRYLEDYKDIHSYFPPMKMQYNGALKMPGVFAPVLDKFSIMPLIPSVIKETNWEETNKKLLQGGIGYIKFESGTKKYKYPPINFYDENWQIDLDISNPATHFSEGLKEQIATSSKIKTESTWGTQMRKLFLANLFSSGQSTEKFKGILSDYIQLLDRVMESQKKSLYKQFGITEEDNEQLVVRNVRDFHRTLQNQVTKNNLNDNIKDFIQYDEATGQFRYPLEISLNKSQIQDLISGLIFKKLTRLKVNGDALIQVSSSGFEKPTNATEQDIKKYGNRDLKFYEPQFDKEGNVTGTSAMQVKVALVGEFSRLLRARDLEGNEIVTIERLNQLLKDPEWVNKNRKKITMVGYRIPTQGPNSMEVMEIAEFLPSVAGSIVILPPEIVAKAGSDYDIDKMFIFRPSMTSSGELSSESSLKEIEAHIKKLEKEIRDYKELDSTQYENTESVNRFINKIFNTSIEDLESGIDENIYVLDSRLDSMISEYLSLKKDIENNDMRVLTNQVMNVYSQVLLSPEMFTQLITPNNTIAVKKVAQDMIDMQGLNFGDFKNTDVLKYSSNVTKFVQLLGGKRDIGVYAIGNTLSQLLQQSGMTVNSSYNIQEVIGKETRVLKRSMTLQLLTPEERESINLSRANEDGSIKDVIDFSSNRDIKGDLKQDFFSQLVNATVDIAADPWYMGLGLNQQTIGPAIYLEHLGVPFERIIYFINQPVIQRFVTSITNQGNQAKWNIIGAEFGLSKPSKLAVLKSIESIDNSKLDQGFYFNEQELTRNIYAPGSSSDWYERKVLSHFLKLQEQGRLLRTLQATFSFDTAKFLTPKSAKNSLLNREDLRKSGLFDMRAAEMIWNNSMISPFNNVEENVRIFSAIMPIGESQSIIQASTELMREFRGDRNSRVRLERVIGNDWIEFLIKNFAEINGVNFEDYSKPLLVQSGTSQTLSGKLSEIKDKYPSLIYYETVRKLYPNSNEKNVTVQNIELYRGVDNTSDYQNVFIEELTQLSDFQGTEIPGSKFSPEQIIEIQDFFRNLAYLAFQQSGFNKGPLFFTDVIPHMQLTPIFSQALRNYQRTIKENPSAEKFWMDSFIEKFKEQNPSFGFTNRKAQAWRGKFYKLSDEGPEDLVGNTPTEPWSGDFDNGEPSEGSIDKFLKNCK